MENRLCLASRSRLLVGITTLPLSKKAILAFLVLGNLVEGVLLALLVLAVGLLGLRNVHLNSICNKTSVQIGLDESWIHVWMALQ